MNILTLALLASTALPIPAAPKDGAALIREMHDRYAGKWYQTLSFVQRTSHPGQPTETWFEAATLPGMLRIDIAPIDSGNALLFRNDTLYQLTHGAIKNSQSMIHPLLVLGFDVYAAPADQTIGKLTKLKIDLAKIRPDTWQGKPVYVVGANVGDNTTPQFWVDQENLLFVRMLQAGPDASVRETQFNRYEKIGGGWIAAEVLFLRDGKVDGMEEYTDIRIGGPFEPRLFNPAAYARPAWVQEPTTGEGVVAAMHARYAGKWYKTLSFVQRVIRQGQPEGEWWEAASIPGKLRIDRAPVDSGNGGLYNGDSLFRFQSRKPAAPTADVNWLLVLGFDVYGQPPERTIALLAKGKFNLAKFRKDLWQGRPVYVVGAAAGDMKASQFWVDAERMLFVRLIEPGPSGGTLEFQFNKYEALGHGWIAPEVIFIRDGTEVMREVYRDMRADPVIDPSIFDGHVWKRPGWIPAGVK